MATSERINFSCFRLSDKTFHLSVLMDFGKKKKTSSL